MQGRIEFISELIQLSEDILVAIEARDGIETDLNMARDAAEVLQEELRSLQ